MESYDNNTSIKPVAAGERVKLASQAKEYKQVKNLLEKIPDINAIC